MSHPDLSLSIRHPNSRVSIIDISGEITAFAEDPLSEAYTKAAGNGVKAIVLNFTDLGYMNSSGIGLLVTMLIRAQRAKQKLLAYGLSDHYTQIFELTRLNEAIATFPDEHEALRAV